MFSPKDSLSPLHCPGASGKGGSLATGSTAPVAQTASSISWPSFCQTPTELQCLSHVTVNTEA